MILDNTRHRDRTYCTKLAVLFQVILESVLYDYLIKIKRSCEKRTHRVSKIGSICENCKGIC